MKTSEHTPPETPEIEQKRELRRFNQPYASEIDERELEHAQREERPIDPEGKASKAPANRN